MHGVVEFAAPAAPMRARDVMRPPIEPCLDRFLLLALAAAADAMRDAGLEAGVDADPERIGCVVSTGGGGLETYEEHAVRRRERGRSAISPFLAPGILTNMAAARIALKYGLRGPSTSITTACAAGAQSVAEGLRLLREGAADVVVCGGVDTPLHPTVAATFFNAKVTAHGFADPAAASRPFDRDRNGFVLAEGAAVLVLERPEHADARGAAGWADVVGWASSTDAFHVTAPRPDGSGAAACLRRALADAGIAPGDVGHLNAHGTGTKVGDLAEARAVRAVFGDAGPAVSATKSVLGHTLGAGGAIEAAVTAVTLARGQLPPTRNLTSVDPECELDHVVGAPRPAAPDFAVSTSFAFGGHNLGLVLAPASTRRRR